MILLQTLEVSEQHRALTEYFLEEESSNKPCRRHINAKNSLEMGGAITRAYRDLMEDLWGREDGRHCST